MNEIVIQVVVACNDFLISITLLYFFYYQAKVLKKSNKLAHQSLKKVREFLIENTHSDKRIPSLNDSIESLKQKKTI
jgi:hypothetical protein